VHLNFSALIESNLMAGTLLRLSGRRLSTSVLFGWSDVTTLLSVLLDCHEIAACMHVGCRTWLTYVASDVVTAS